MGKCSREIIIRGGGLAGLSQAYPLFEIGYRKQFDVIHDYLSRFKNLYIAGRSGMFRYYNMDIAIKSRIETAEKIIREQHELDDDELAEMVLTKT